MATKMATQKTVQLANMPASVPNTPMLANGQPVQAHRVTWVRLSTGLLLHTGKLSQAAHNALYGAYVPGGNNALAAHVKTYLASKVVGVAYANGVATIKTPVPQSWLPKVLGAANWAALQALNNGTGTTGTPTSAAQQLGNASAPKRSKATNALPSTLTPAFVCANCKGKNGSTPSSSKPTICAYCYNHQNGVVVHIPAQPASAPTS